MPVLRWRIVGEGFPPQRTEVPVPGWGGAPEPRADGSGEHPWQCTPFSESARYGLEILYPWDREMHVSIRDGKVVADLAGEDDPALSSPPPIVPVKARFYLFAITLDLKPPPGFAIRTEPHPRYWTDESGAVPIAIPGLIRTTWWPSASTIVFKAPAPGQTHIFRKGEPFVQVICVPEEPGLELEPMGEEAAAERELQARRIEASREALAEKSRWVSSSNIEFDGAYRHMLRAAKARVRDAR